MAAALSGIIAGAVGGCIGSSAAGSATATANAVQMISHAQFVAISGKVGGSGARRRRLQRRKMGDFSPDSERRQNAALPDGQPANNAALSEGMDWFNFHFNFPAIRARSNCLDSVPTGVDIWSTLLVTTGVMIGVFLFRKFVDEVALPAFYRRKGEAVPFDLRFPFPCWEIRILEIEFLGISEAVGFAIGTACGEFASTAFVIIVILILPLFFVAYLIQRGVTKRCHYVYNDGTPWSRFWNEVGAKPEHALEPRSWSQFGKDLFNGIVLGKERGGWEPKDITEELTHTHGTANIHHTQGRTAQQSISVYGAGFGTQEENTDVQLHSSAVFVGASDFGQAAFHPNASQAPYGGSLQSHKRGTSKRERRMHMRESAAHGHQIDDFVSRYGPIFDGYTPNSWWYGIFGLLMAFGIGLAVGAVQEPTTSSNSVFGLYVADLFVKFFFLPSSDVVEAVQETSTATIETSQMLITMGFSSGWVSESWFAQAFVVFNIVGFFPSVLGAMGSFSGVILEVLNFLYRNGFSFTALFGTCSVCFTILRDLCPVLWGGSSEDEKKKYRHGHDGFDRRPSFDRDAYGQISQMPHAGSAHARLEFQGLPGQGSMSLHGRLSAPDNMSMTVGRPGASPQGNKWDWSLTSMVSGGNKGANSNPASVAAQLEFGKNRHLPPMPAGAWGSAPPNYGSVPPSNYSSVQLGPRVSSNLPPMPNFSANSPPMPNFSANYGGLRQYSPGPQQPMMFGRYQ